MPIYSYRSSTMDGTIVEGAIEAPDEKSAIEKIKDKGVIPLKVTIPREGIKWRIRLQVVNGRPPCVLLGVVGASRRGAPTRQEPQHPLRDLGKPPDERRRPVRRGIDPGGRLLFRSDPAASERLPAVLREHDPGRRGRRGAGCRTGQAQRVSGIDEGD